ncbi:MAG: hypothetical protein WCV80_01615 [Candidatus Paceibacterota bacterium]|jgi:hypothetical protein
MTKKDIIQKLQFLLKQLSSEPLVGGLQISDYALQYVALKGGVQTASVKMPPGVVREGRLVDGVQFFAYLKQLHQIVLPGKEKEPIPVTVTLPPNVVYTQSFTVPNVGSERLAESAALNIQMISPMSPDTAYISWQVIRETPDQYELLGAFAEKKYVDEFQKFLEESYFSSVAFEFPSLSLSRLIALAGSADDSPSLLLQISSDGLNLSILKSRGLYFDYFRSWRSVQGESRQITRERFEEVIAEEIQKVINFTLSKFKESPKKLFMIAPGFETEVQNFVQLKFGISVAVLQITTWNISSQWYAAVGAALRESESRKRDILINVGSGRSGQYFYEEQGLKFLHLWRTIIIGVLGIFLLLFSGSAYVLASELKSTQRNLSIFSARIPAGELQRLEENVRVFNALVKTARSVKDTSEPWTTFFSRIKTIAAANKAVIDSIGATSLKKLITLNAHVADNNAIITFKNAIAAEKDFKDVDLLVSQITTREDGSAGFQLTFFFVGIPSK